MAGSGRLSWVTMDATLNSIGHGVVVCDSRGVIQFVNPAAQKLFQTQDGELEGQNLSCLFLPDDMEMLYPNLMHLGQTCQEFEGELMLRRGDESEFFAYLTLRTCPDDPDTPEDEGLIILGIQDIDQRKRLERILEKTHYDELVTIADTIAHELRNPLVGIGSFVNRLYKTCQHSADQEAYYKFVLDNLHRIEDLVKKVHTLVNLPFPQYAAEQISSLLDRALKDFGEEVKRRGIRLLRQADDISFRVDGGLLVKAIAILVDNALDAVEDGGEVRVSAEPDGHCCRIVVSDDGAGIAESDLPNIFNPFFSTKADGIGIDLALVRRIAEMHGGSVKVSSSPGQGARFEMDIPLERRRSIRTVAISADGEGGQAAQKQ